MSIDLRTPPQHPVSTRPPNQAPYGGKDCTREDGANDFGPRWPPVYGHLCLALSQQDDNSPTMCLGAVTGQSQHRRTIYKVGTHPPARNKGDRHWRGDLTLAGGDFDGVDVLPQLPKWLYAKLLDLNGLRTTQPISSLSQRRLAILRALLTANIRTPILAEKFATYWRRGQAHRDNGRWVTCHKTQQFLIQVLLQAQQALKDGSTPDWSTLVGAIQPHFVPDGDSTLPAFDVGATDLICAAAKGGRGRMH